MDAQIEPREPCSLDEIEALIAEAPQVEMPRDDIFVPGFYLRRIYMSAGTVLTSKRHITRHPFIVTKGKCLVRDEAGELVMEITAPYVGITEPGTRRALYILEDTVWTTIHPILPEEHERLDLIEQRIIEPNDNPLLEPETIKLLEGTFR